MKVTWTVWIYKTLQRKVKLSNTNPTKTRDELRCPKGYVIPVPHMAPVVLPCDKSWLREGSECDYNKLCDKSWLKEGPECDYNKPCDKSWLRKGPECDYNKPCDKSWLKEGPECDNNKQNISVVIYHTDVAVNQVIMATVKLSTWWLQLSI
jgi:hypothetical protein